MRSKGYTPLPNSFVGYRDSTFSKQILDVAKTECESMIEPHGTQDDVGWKTISTITEFLFHTRHCRGKLGNLTEPNQLLDLVYRTGKHKTVEEALDAAYELNRELSPKITISRGYGMGL